VREPQAFEILAAAYAEETDVRVKIAIVESLSEFTVPEAAELLNRAIEDSNPAVREAAQQAKRKRDMRLLFTRCCR
jgi:HEAT repeat protein